MIGQTISHYRIVSRLGEGGMGVVYVAEDTLLGRRVAIKIPAHAPGANNSYHARFLREARSVSALSHPYIAPVFDFGELPDGRPFIVMELINGQDLGALMAAGALTLQRAVEIVEQVAIALGEAHRLGIIHRDVKPSNILINERGEVKVLDFGLAKLLEDHPAFARIDSDARTLQALQTQSDIIIGTPLYLSPEQASGAPVDARSDLFTLGALLYEAIAGRPPFGGGNLIEIAAEVLRVDPPPPSTLNTRVPPELDRITMKALAKRPEERYQTAADFARDLRAFREAYQLSDSAGVARIPRRTYVQNRSALVTISEGLRRPRLSIATVLVGIAVLLVALWGVSQLLRKRPHQPRGEALQAYNTGMEFLRDNAYYRANKAFERAVESDDQYALAHARLAETWTELDYTDRAKDEMLKVVTLVPDSSILPPLDALYLDAVKFSYGRNFAQAVNTYEEIARRTPDQPQALVDLGRAYESAGQIPKAIDSYVAATNRDGRYATAYLRVGILYGRQRELASANNCFDRAEQIYKDLGNSEGRTEVLYQRGLLYRNTGHIPEAHTYLEQARKLAETTNNQAQRVSALLQLSTVAFAENESGRAEQLAREGVEIAQTNGMENLTAVGLVDLANVYWVRADYPQAEKYYQQALEFANRYNVRRAAAKAYINLGSLRLRQSKPDDTITYVNKALAFYQPNNYRTETAQGLLILGRANTLKGDYKAALQAFELQLPLAEQLGDQAQAAYAHEFTGTVLEIQERYTEALPHYEQKYALSNTLKQQKGMGWGLTERASILWQLGRYDEARPLLTQAAAIADRPDGYKDVSTAVAVVQAALALSERQFASAQAQAERIVALKSDTESTATAQRILCLAQTLSGNARAGRRRCEEALDLATRSGNPHLIAGATLALAQALVEGDDAQGALAAALRAHESFTQTGQTASDWLAWLVAARASLRVGDQAKAHEYAAHARETLENNQQRWGAEAYNSYLKRADVQFFRQQLEKL